jgi:hypothetical protein
MSAAPQDTVALIVGLDIVLHQDPDQGAVLDRLLVSMLLVRSTST